MNPEHKQKIAKLAIELGYEDSDDGFTCASNEGAAFYAGAEAYASLVASDAAKIKKLTAIANRNANSCDALAQEIERLRERLAAQQAARSEKK